MNLRDYIYRRVKSGHLHIFLKQIPEIIALYPNDEFLKQEYQYWKKVYWLSGDFTRIAGIDNRWMEKKKSWLLQKYDVKKTKLNDITLVLDHPALYYLILLEYQDIYPLGMYYDKAGHWLNTPNFIPGNITSEGPYETKDVQLHEGDVVIDCGSNMGLFSILAVKRGAKTIYAFDPQKRAQEILKENAICNNCNENIVPVSYGLSDKKCTLSFVEDNDNMGGSHITQDESAATTTIECTTIDDFVSENNIPRIDFIKADIEGAERDMLNGARKTIKRDHPRLAICTYHLPDDPEVIRDIILSIDPTYHIDQRSAKLYAW